MLKVVLALGTTQTLAWASGYYIPAIIAVPISKDLGISPSVVFTAFSLALLISALLGPRVGRRIDRVGGRGVLALSNIVLATGLVALSQATGVAGLFFAWAVLGVGIGIGLYDAAFAALGRLYGSASRAPITGITLMAGLASTVGWPLTAWGVAEIGWRDTCLAWAAAHLVIGLPLNLIFLPRAAGEPDPASAAPVARALAGTIAFDRNMWLLAISFASAWIVTAAMAAHLPRLLQLSGASYTTAVLAASLLGPAQVAARLAEITLGRRHHPLLSARIAALGHPAGAALLLLGGAPMATLFSVLHGAGNGVLTIARGTVPLAIFGPVGYGHRIGLLGAPSRIAQAFAPAVFGGLVEWSAKAALLTTSALSVLAFGALLLIKPHDAADR
ncbi:MAG: MFS transporter [Hyphomicrobiaceae bacterium]